MTELYPIDKKTCRGCEWLVETIGDPEDDDLAIYECDNKTDCHKWIHRKCVGRR